MVKLTESEIKFLEENKLLLRRNDLISFSKNLSKLTTLEHINITKFILEKIKTDIFKYFSNHIPKDFFPRLLFGFNISEICIDNTLIIPSNITYIDDEAFESCAGFTKLILSESVKTIGAGAFSGCEDLLEIELPDSLIDMGDECFSDCYSLKKVIIKSPKFNYGDDIFFRSSIDELYLHKNFSDIDEDKLRKEFNLPRDTKIKFL